MRLKITCRTIILLLSVSIAEAQTDCSFEQEQEKYNPASAMEDAVAAFNNGNLHFIDVANGYGSAKPGLEKIEKTQCIFFDTTWVTLWVGADSMTCKDHKRLEDRALRYARNFNRAMIKLLVTNETEYKCVDDLQPAH